MRDVRPEFAGYRMDICDVGVRLRRPVGKDGLNMDVARFSGDGDAFGLESALIQRRQEEANRSIPVPNLEVPLRSESAKNFSTSRADCEVMRSQWVESGTAAVI